MSKQEKIHYLQKKKTPSSQKWLLRHFNDPYVHQAQKQGYRCRSAFKLLEMDEKYKIFRPGMNVLDLGCFPGGWCQVAMQCLKATGMVIGIDKQLMNELPNVIFCHGDILESKVERFLEGKSFHVVLSDLAPSCTGHAPTDRLKMEELTSMVWQFALKILLPQGTLVMKIFHGHDELINSMNSFFQSVRYAKPSASRSASKEIYVIASQFKGKS